MRDSSEPSTARRPPRPGPPGGAAHWETERSSDLENLGRRLARLAARSLRLLPRSVVRIASSAYIAGEDHEQALAKARQVFEARGVHSTIDVLGEDVQSLADIEAYQREYGELIDDLAGLEYANISIKLSALGQRLDEDDCIERTATIVELARRQNVFVRFDMEDASTVDSTLHVYRTMRERGLDNCGVVLQSRLFRTREDVRQLLPLKPNVRLCIGIYREPADIALQEKDAMKHHLLELLETMWENGQHVAIATHEEWVIRKALDLAKRMGKPDEEIEVQMLLGVPSEPLQNELVARRIRVRLYVPFGKHWYAYSMRRLENNPDVIRMVAINLFRSLFSRNSRGARNP